MKDLTERMKHELDDSRAQYNYPATWAARAIALLLPPESEARPSGGKP